jgi:hypothetical protein
MDFITGTPVNLNYHMPLKFTGKAGRVRPELAPEKFGAADWERLKQAGELIGLPD